MTEKPDFFVAGVVGDFKNAEIGVDVGEIKEISLTALPKLLLGNLIHVHAVWARKS